MNEPITRIYDFAHGKRMAREVAPSAGVIALVLGIWEHEPWWFILPVALLAVVAGYWFWRACDYLAFHVVRRPRSSDRDSAA